MRHGIAAFAFVLISGLLLSGDLTAGNLEPPGPPAPTMKTIQEVESRTPISSLPATITAPGSYYLTGDLVGVSGQAGITITTSHVTLDLNGFALVGVAGSLEGITAFGLTRHLVIRNGTVRNWGARGLLAFGSTDVHVEDLRLDTNGTDGMMVGARSIVRATTASGNVGNGIVTGVNSTVVGCTSGSNGASGFVLGAGSAVSDSTAANNSTLGFTLNGGSVATDCTAQNNQTGFGLLTAARVVRSNARANAVGINGGSRASIEGCTVDSNTDDGIVVTGQALVRGNSSRVNLNDGIHATGSGNRIEENAVGSNAVGIRVDLNNNVIVRNTAVGNNLDYQIAGGNLLGPISTDPATAGPWANFDH